jgi:hypothetical protein
MAEEEGMNDLDLYEDEPMTSVRPKEFSGNQMVIENMDEVERKRQKRKRRRKKRLERLGKLAVCVCCAGVLAAIIVTIVLTEAAIAVTTPVPPTVGPTPMPAVPTYKPTIARPTMKVPKPTTKRPTVAAPTPPRGPPTIAPTYVVLDSYDLTASQDTYIVTKGPNLASAHGNQETMLVQTGFVTNDNDQDTVGLLIFDTSKIPSFDLLATEGKKAVLKLYHKPLSVTQQSREPAPITVSRMDITQLKIETLSGSNFQPKGYWDGPTVKVPLDATEVTFDITDLYFNAAFNQDQLFLMLQTRNQEQKDGDLFYTRESDKPPLLFLTGLLP